MNQRPQPRPAPAQANMARPSNSTPVEIRKLAEELTVVMDALLGTIERETALVRAGKVREALQLASEKSGLSRRYMVAVEKLKASQQILSQAAPELLNTLRRDHDTFRAMLQINLTVLATAHAVSEGIIRGVNTELQRRNMPNTYTASGQRAAPNRRQVAPLAVSRSL